MTQFKVGHSFYPKTPITPNQNSSTTKLQIGQGSKNSFAQHLQQKLQEPELKFSQHARIRLEERGIDLSSELIDRLNEGMKKAQVKGSKESLLLMEGLAFVVSVKNKTVITAIEQKSMSDQVITNIDSAVIL
jgi:flagellar operon protein